MDAPPIDNPLLKLNARQRSFVLHYCDTLIATKAALAAGYSDKTARSQGQRLLTNVDIKAAVSYLGEQMGMPVGEAVRRMSRWAAGTMEPFMDEAGNLVLDSEDALENRHLIKKVKQKKTVSIQPDGTIQTEYWTEIELYDAKDATDKVLQLHGRYKQLPGDLGDKEPKQAYRLPDGTLIIF